MRKHQQQQILTLLETLYEANDEIRSLFSQRNFSAVIGLLADCQEFVVQIGNYIENTAGEGTRTVSLLEDFHDCLYDASIELGGESPDGAFITHHRNLLDDIKTSVKTELEPDKIEVVFLPYKASMWDSLESIWLAARDDSRCEAYVVPIPYYDKLSNGSLGEMHYEADLYPDYVPVTDWRDYDFEARRPDIVFIHNPYDGANYVTTVHPNFYSTRLKNFTQLLVYVPYYVAMYDSVEESFCLSPGVLNSDKVIVQSENVRETHISVIKEFAKTNNRADLAVNIRKRIVALGSPKFDKVINSSPEDFDLPAKWRALIERPDGTGKPVILYNTSVSAILRGNEEYLKKIRRVLDTFRKRDEVVLWWRPHPLNEATYASMRDWLLDEYLHLVDEYKRDGYGIFDDTADLSRALALSDAYFGDISSLVPLYECVGKKVLIQNTDTTPFTVSTPSFQFASEYENGLLFVSHLYDAVFKLDVQSGIASAVVPYQKVSYRAGLTFRSVAVVKNKIFCVPGTIDYIAVFDIDRNDYEDAILVPPPEKDIIAPGAARFNSAVAYKDSVFFIPGLYPAILKCDINTKRLESYDDWVDDLAELSHSDWFYFWKTSCSVENGKLVLPSSRANAVVVFDLDEYTSKVYAVGGHGVCYTDCCFDGRYYWLAPAYTEKIIKWDMETGVYKEIDIITNSEYESSPGRIRYGGCCYAGGYVWMLPANGDVALKIDVSSDEVSVAHEFQAVFEEVIDPPEPFVRYSYVKAKGSEIIAYCAATESIIKYDCLSGEMTKAKVTITQTDAIRSTHYARQFPSNSKRVRYTEMTDICLDKYIDFMSIADSIALNDDNEEPGSAKSDTGDAGAKILSHCKKAIKF